MTLHTMRQAANVAAPDPDLLVAGESVVEETLTA